MKPISVFLSFLVVLTTSACEYHVFVQDSSPVNITSPGFESGSYPQDVHCTWNITTDPQNRLVVKFDKFDLEDHVRCGWDYCIIHNGSCSSGNGKKFCGKQLLDKTVYSKYNSLCLEFVSDTVIVKTGFRALVSVLVNNSNLPSSSTPISASIQTIIVTHVAPQNNVMAADTEMCLDTQTEYNVTQGYIVSPNYGDNKHYLTNQTCQLAILNPTSSEVTFEFLDFDVEFRAHCSWDNLTFTEVFEDNQKLHEPLCGTQIPKSIVLEAPTVLIKFMSDHIVTRRGFRIKYHVRLKGTTSSLMINTQSAHLTDTSKTLSSSLSDVETSLDTVLQSTQKPGTSQTEMQASTSYNEDSLYTQWRTSSTKDYEMESSSAFDITEPSENSEPSITNFHTTSSITPSSMPVVTSTQLLYKEMCTGTTFLNIHNHAVIYSPNYEKGQNYTKNKNCSLTIKSVTSKRLHINFIYFKLEFNPFCIWDYLKVFDGLTNTAPSLGIFCGSKTGISLVSSGNSIHFWFHSDHIVTAKGFYIKVYIGEDVSDGDDVSQTPTRSFLSASTTVTTEASYQVRTATFSPGVNHDTTSTVTNVDPITPSYTQPEVTQTTSEVVFSIKSTSSVINDQVFEAYMCSGNDDVYVDEELVLYSPNYGSGKYPLNVNCGLILKSHNTKTFAIEISFFKLEQHSSCAWDSLSLYDGKTDTAQSMGVLCGEVAKTTLFTSGSQVYMKFISDHVVPADGFELRIKTMSSESYISDTYTTLITPTPASSSTEEYSSTVTSPSPFTTSMLPPLTTSDPLTKFEMCSGLSTLEISDGPYVDIYSPGYLQGNEYPTNTECTLNVTSSDKKLEVQILDLHMEKHLSCLWDSLTIHDGPLSASPVLDKLCGDITGVVYISTSSHLYLSFKSDYIIPDKGFHIKIGISTNVPKPTSEPSTTSQTISTPQPITTSQPTTTPEQAAITAGQSFTVKLCSGISSYKINGSSDVNLYSPGYLEGKDYPLSTECIFHVYADENKKIRVTIADLHIETHVACTWDSLTLYDGPDKLSPVLEMMCGDMVNVVYHSSGSNIFFDFKSDYIIPDKGFHIQLQMMSGTQTISTETTRSPLTTTTQTESTEKTTLPSITTDTVHSTTTQLPVKTTLPHTALSPQPKTKLSTVTTPTLQTTTTDTTNTVATMQTTTTTTTTSPTTRPIPTTTTTSPTTTTTTRLTTILTSPITTTPTITTTTSPLTTTTTRLTTTTSTPATTAPATTTTATLKTTMNTTITSSKPIVITTTVTNRYSCRVGELQCKDDSCVPIEWKCDGELDCTDGLDEQSCNVCSDNEFSCRVGECLPRNKRCDGNVDCTNSADETNCVKLADDHIVHVMHKDEWFPVCKDDWNTKVADAVCQYTSFGRVNSTFGEILSSPKLMTLKKNTDKYPITRLHTLFKPVTTCSTQTEVKLSCNESGESEDHRETVNIRVNRSCGKRNNFIQPYIIGGTRSTIGQWPWMVVIKIGATFICGGTLVSRQWVVTASHCVHSISRRPHLLNLFIGSNQLHPADIKALKVMEIILHPENDFIYNADIALLRLLRPVTLTDYVNPLCIPTGMHTISESSICYAAGWGPLTVSDAYSTILPEYLHHAKMKIVLQSKCEKAYQGKVKKSMICAGYDLGRLDTCKGDSGGPLMCRVDEDRWIFVGVTSWGETPCGQILKPGVYTRVEHFRDWLTTTTLENDKNSNCTFEKPSICGFIDNSEDNFIWTRRTWKPMFDHTYKNISGHFMYAESSSDAGAKGSTAILRTPLLTSQSIKCMVFAVAFPGTLSDLELKVITHASSNDLNGLQIMKVSPFSIDWMLANVIIPAEVSFVDIVAVHGKRDNTGIALDDVTFNEGVCKDLLNMSCDFDSGHTCMYSNDKDDIFDWEINTFNDNGSNTDFHILFSGAGRPVSVMSRLSSPILESSLFPRCLTFDYQICPAFSGHLTIMTYYDFGGSSLLRSPIGYIYTSSCNSWLSASIDVPDKSYPYGIAIEASKGVTDGNIRIDNINMFNGNCF